MSKIKRNPNEKRSDTVNSVYSLLRIPKERFTPEIVNEIQRGLRMAYMAGCRHEASRLRREFKHQQETE